MVIIIAVEKPIQTPIREEELKNRVATAFFGKYDCDRIVGNIDFCVLPKRRDPRQLSFIPDAPIFWAEAKNHPTDVHRMLAQLILTIGRAASPRRPNRDTMALQFDVDADFGATIMRSQTPTPTLPTTT